MHGSRHNRRARDGGAADLIGRVNLFEQEAILTASPQQVRRIVRIVRKLLWRLGSAPLDADAVAAYLAGLRQAGAAEKTLLNHRSAISRFCRHLVSRGALAKNPAAAVAVRRPADRPPIYLCEAERLDALGLARTAGIFPEVLVALATGLRLSELQRLQWQDLDIEQRALLVRKAKNRKPRTVPLSDEALEGVAAQRARCGPEVAKWVFPARQTWPGGWRYRDRIRSMPSWSRSIAPVQEAVEAFRRLPGRSTGRGWHLFRHTFASRLAQAGVSLYKIAEWLGHSDVRMTRVYAHLAPGYDPDIERGSGGADAGR